ncbi:MAG TPA: hypothetical protein VJ672_16510 [Gemmatimonadaceae bacterium]|nr:hypothetical protein [Gemmatimonadaceae bacterium]
MIRFAGSPGMSLVASVVVCVLVAGTAEAQGPDLVQVTFNRAFGRGPVGAPTDATSSQAQAAIAAGRAAAELPTDVARLETFMRLLEEAMPGDGGANSAPLVAAIVRESFVDLNDDRAYLHARIAEVTSVAEALAEQATEMSEASVRVTSQLSRNSPMVQVTLVNVDARLFANDDSEVRRTRSCDPCFTKRNARLKLSDLEREMANATLVQNRVMGRREELIGRGADFNRRAQAVVQSFAEVLKQLDARKGGAISVALRGSP